MTDISLLQAGTYIVAVSGGVDSMVLLDMLRQQEQLTLYVAHVNHGMRPDSDQDEELVATFCVSHNIPYSIKRLQLGAGTGEAEARTARYEYLRHCRTEQNAKAIITAHHQDDLIETALINLIRGTGWRGLAPFVGVDDLLRPLINVPKAELYKYAADHAIPWREDSTNTDERYLRNSVRHSLVPLLQRRNAEWRDDFMRLVRNQRNMRRTIESELNHKLTLCVVVNGTTASLHRYFWIMLPAAEAYELFQALCRAHTGNSLVRELGLQALLFIKTAKPGKRMPLGNDWQLRADSSQIIVEPRSSVVSKYAYHYYL
jgi:tRNA(Ile)-lysidine synthase